MHSFLKEEIVGEKFELIIDANLFSRDLVFKAAYNLLDKGYFFFKYDGDKNIVLQFSRKKGAPMTPEEVIGEFSDELLDVYLRDKIEETNRVIREAIVTKAINGPYDMNNFVTLDTDVVEDKSVNVDADIDEILKDIENEPDLHIDEEEIEKILEEIQKEHQIDITKPELNVNPDALADLKEKFKNK